MPKKANALTPQGGEDEKRPGPDSVKVATSQRFPDQGRRWRHCRGKPDDAVLLDMLLDWAPDEMTQHKILVENPARLYGF